MRALLLVPPLLSLAACGGGGADRVVRAADAMEHLRGVRFSLDASSVASGSPSLAGDLVLTYRATGEVVPPDRLRIAVSHPEPATLEIAGQSVRLNGQPASATALRTLASPIAVLEQLREAGAVRFSGLGFARGNVTARYIIDRGDRGVVEVELGLLDDLVRRQTFTVSEAVPPEAQMAGSGPTTVRTTYTVEYWDYGADLDIRPIRPGGEPDRP
ncbi:MAG TPA: hypothetical protein VGS17_02910 [Candidatus Limnocylindria bacterium]|nr:hypothetical protein [Candidatus Limnocylindria bacterium]